MKNILLATVIIMSITVNSQTKNHFKFESQSNGMYETVFTILGNTNDNNIQNIIEKLTSYQEVSSCKIFYNKRCKVLSTRKLPIRGVRKVLTKYGTDIDIDYCVINNKVLFNELNQSKISNLNESIKAKPKKQSEWVFPTDFPQYEETGNKTVDDKNYSRRKVQWIENNPEKWKEITGIEYLDYSNKL